MQVLHQARNRRGCLGRRCPGVGRLYSTRVGRTHFLRATGFIPVVFVPCKGYCPTGINPVARWANARRTQYKSGSGLTSYQPAMIRSMLERFITIAEYSAAKSLLKPSIRALGWLVAMTDCRH